MTLPQELCSMLFIVKVHIYVYYFPRESVSCKFRIQGHTDVEPHATVTGLGKSVASVTLDSILIFNRYHLLLRSRSEPPPRSQILT